MNGHDDSGGGVGRAVRGPVEGDAHGGGSPTDRGERRKTTDTKRGEMFILDPLRGESPDLGAWLDFLDAADVVALRAPVSKS